MASNRHVAKAGDSIRATIGEFPKGKATAYLFSASQAIEHDRAKDGQPVVCTKMAHLNASNNSVTWEIESDGEWVVRIQDDEANSAYSELIQKKP
jgi:hypothetical protein